MFYNALNEAIMEQAEFEEWKTVLNAVLGVLGDCAYQKMFVARCMRDATKAESHRGPGKRDGGASGKGAKEANRSQTGHRPRRWVAPGNAREARAGKTQAKPNAAIDPSAGQYTILP